jgi:putative spermidine/putrescine transport system ATP-binding protein/spermidine/putrescine transport system ATP-binding protein
VSVVIPAEAVEVHALDKGGRDAIAEACSGNVIDARIRRFDVVGHISHLSVALPDGRMLALEAHVDKYPPGAFAVDALVALAFKPENATVIPAH